MANIERTAELCPNPGQPQDAGEKPGPATIEAPEGVEIDIVVYLHSDYEDLDVAVGLHGLPALAPFKPTFNWSALLGSAGAALKDLADDWRVMSRAEIAAYKLRQREFGDG
jgi:hypothetical protein